MASCSRRFAKAVIKISISAYQPVDTNPIIVAQAVLGRHLCSTLSVSKMIDSGEGEQRGRVTEGQLDRDRKERKARQKGGEGGRQAQQRSEGKGESGRGQEVSGEDARTVHRGRGGLWDARAAICRRGGYLQRC